MNTPERNKKNIKKIREIGKVYEETSDDTVSSTGKDNADKNKIEQSYNREYPLETARKISWILCGALWLFCLVGLLFGMDFRATFPFLMFSLAAVVILQLPVFWIKKKPFDVVTGIIFASGCIVLGLSMLLGRGGGA